MHSSAGPSWAVGLMTGTVLDGNIDVAMIRTDGRSISEFGSYTLSPYDDETMRLLEQAVNEAQLWQFADEPEPAVFREVEHRLTIAQSDAVAALLSQAGLSRQEVTVVGFHGQTVLHRAPADGQSGRTRQLGDGALMARRLGIDVVHDFRSNDVRAGGQGAPLSAVYHQALLQQFGENWTPDNTAEQKVDLRMGQRVGTSIGQRTNLRTAQSASLPLTSTVNAAVLNLGGVANITWTDHKENLVGFDTGPANAPLNDFMMHRGLGRMDRDGALAATGVVDEQRLDKLLEHPYLQQRYPKSLDRFDFTRHMADGLNDEDGAALLCAFTAAAVGKGLALLPEMPTHLIVCGGGRHNPVLMRELKTRAGVICLSAEQVGWRGDAIEAECFAYLAIRTLKQLPLSFPGTTGVPAPLCGGVISRAVTGT